MKAQLYPKLLIALTLLLISLTSGAQSYMRTNLYVVASNGSTVLMDGNLTNYNTMYSNEVDMYDAWKMNNFGENFGIIRKNQVLVIERRNNFKRTDTTFFKMWNMRLRNYRLQVITKDFAQRNTKAFLLDSYFKKKYAVTMNDTSYYNFAVTNDARSYDKFRFQLQYEVEKQPFTMVAFEGFRDSKNIQLEWNVKNESEIAKYIIEHAADGRNFTELQAVAANITGTNAYELTHFMPSDGEHFYRIKIVDNSGNFSYSSIVKVKGFSIAAVYPNPVLNKTVTLILENTFEKINLNLVDPQGKQINLPAITTTSVQKSIKINLPSSIAPGVYFLKLSTGFYQQVIPLRVM